MTSDHRSVVRRSAPPESATRPLGTPLSPAVAYWAPDADALDAIYEGGAAGFTYGREGHPNWQVLAEKLDWMEGAAGGVLMGSGMAAVGAVFLAVLKAGDHVVAGDQLYGRSLRLLNEELPRMGVSVSLVDATDGAAFAAAIRPETRLALVEVVANPTLRVADMPAILAACRARGVALAVDNTFTTPRLYRPLAEGADYVIHSVTKLLAGHADVTLGYVGARAPEAARRVYDISASWGLTPAPFDCWLAERGLHTFDLRFERAQANAAALADRLAALPGVEAVLYPARPDHPDHNRARAICGDEGGYMVSFRLRGGRAVANRFLRAAEHLPFAPTLGDVATTLSHPASSSHRGMSPAAREAIGITEGFIRVSVGIEDPGLILPEFEAAVAAAGAAAPDPAPAPAPAGGMAAP
ncbi:aminotransferase class I/II-fold pyridoxal phosphate-dependent enzyme [Paralimibaculum aggregatum]|uniref:Aminotransferase class I/II-fold pyridoxal phosphate-dependent enzyme n=1 Tax=Paralimibaculum aggregatum TaxID=3036245 RepID=A0ABQ6LM56_9RHOB|nr:PLP-dependent transferase [Limibaculum sp. NKW23]GMG81908.1 aminotransferase class I/II-fold pyridoxal phosphate-dependent enzyme [Limibaculum sp. NKW23]